MKYLMVMSSALFLSVSALAQTAPADSSLNVIKNPKELSLQLPFSQNSDENGICRHLGFAEALQGSKEIANLFKKETVRVDAEGTAVAAPEDGSVSQIVCRGIVTSGAMAKVPLSEVKRPREVQTRYPVSVSSSPDGICKMLGFKSAFPESLRIGGKSDVIVIEASGVPSRVQLKTKSVDRLVCVAK